VSKTVTTGTGSTTEKYYLDGNQIAFVTDGSGNQTFHYLYGLNVDQVMAQDSPAGMVWALADRLGSIETLTDGEGVVVDKRTFDSFGRVLSETNPSVSFRYGYTGREQDLESGLNYYRARYYDPNVGRFISVDPMGFGAGDTNLYRYVGNNSTNWTDPTGEYAQVGALAAGGAIFGGLGALFNDIETGQFGWNTIGNVVKGAAVGAVLGAAIGLGVGALAAGATTAFGTAAAGAAVETTAAFGFAAKSAYDAGGNFGEGRYLSGALDLVGVGLGAFQTAKGINRDIPGIIRQEAAVRAQAKIDTLNRVETRLDSLTNQTHALSNIIESADGRAGSGFGEFSQRANTISTAISNRVVTAEARVGGQVFKDFNQTGRLNTEVGKPTLISEQVAAKAAKKGKPQPNGTMEDAHAEVGSIQQAFDAGITMGADMEMTVTGLKVCDYCRSDVPHMAEKAGLNSLTLFEAVTGKTLIWKKGTKKLKEVKA
jgi:RHS repeat-associated protein